MPDDGQVAEFADLNLKLLVIEVLAYRRKLVPRYRPPRQVHPRWTGLTHLLDDDHDFDVQQTADQRRVAAALAHFRRLPLPRHGLDSLEELDVDGGLKVYADAAPQYWGGEEDIFSIRDLSDLDLLPRLRRIRGPMGWSAEQRRLLALRGIEVDVGAVSAPVVTPAPAPTVEDTPFLPTDTSLRHLITVQLRRHAPRGRTVIRAGDDGTLLIDVGNHWLCVLPTAHGPISVRLQPTASGDLPELSLLPSLAARTRPGEDLFLSTGLPAAFAAVALVSDPVLGESVRQMVLLTPEETALARSLGVADTVALVNTAVPLGVVRPGRPDAFHRTELFHHALQALAAEGMPPILPRAGADTAWRAIDHLLRIEHTAEHTEIWLSRSSSELILAATTAGRDVHLSNESNDTAELVLRPSGPPRVAVVARGLRHLLYEVGLGGEGLVETPDFFTAARVPRLRLHLSDADRIAAAAKPPQGVIPSQVRAGAVLQIALPGEAHDELDLRLGALLRAGLAVQFGCPGLTFVPAAESRWTADVTEVACWLDELGFDAIGDRPVEMTLSSWGRSHLVLVGPQDVDRLCHRPGPARSIVLSEFEFHRDRLPPRYLSPFPLAAARLRPLLERDVLGAATDSLSRLLPITVTEAGLEWHPLVDSPLAWWTDDGQVRRAPMQEPGLVELLRRWRDVTRDGWTGVRIRCRPQLQLEYLRIPGGPLEPVDPQGLFPPEATPTRPWPAADPLWHDDLPTWALDAARTTATALQYPVDPQLATLRRAALVGPPPTVPEVLQHPAWRVVWDEMCDVLGPRLLTDRSGGPSHAQQVDLVLRRTLAHRRMADLLELGRAAGLDFPVHTIDPDLDLEPLLTVRRWPAQRFLRTDPALRVLDRITETTRELRFRLLRQLPREQK